MDGDEVPERSVPCDFDVAKYDKEVREPALYCGRLNLKYLEKGQSTASKDVREAQVEIEEARLYLLVDRKVLVKYLKEHWRDPVKGILFFERGGLFNNFRRWKTINN